MSPLKIALPSERQMEEPTLLFMEASGLTVVRQNSRAYTGNIAAVPEASVMFQRTTDMTRNIEEGSIDLAIMGLERHLEDRVDGGNSIVVIENLGYAGCELVVGVLESWIDVTSMSDLADLALEMHASGKHLRIATKYPRLTQSFFIRHGINYFEIVAAAGAMEVAPTMGYADLIVDITSTGNTLRENKLKMIKGGTLVKSEACMVGSIPNLAGDSSKLKATQEIIEMIEGRSRAKGYYNVVANLYGKSEADVAKKIISKPSASGLQGPTISRVYSKDGDSNWYSVSVMVPKAKLMEAVGHFHEAGGKGLAVLPTQYVFEGESPAYKRLVSQLKPAKVKGKR